MIRDPEVSTELRTVRVVRYGHVGRNRLAMLAVLFRTVDSNERSESFRETRAPWAESLVRLEQISIQNVTKEQELVLERSNIPEAMWPYVNITAVVERERRRNATDGGIITDKDVADIPDDDKLSQPNTMHTDGKKTTIIVSTEAGIQLYQHWTDQAVSGLMAAFATDKLGNVGDVGKHAHMQCNKEVKTVAQHARCVVQLLEAERKYQKWLRKSEHEIGKKRKALLKRRISGVKASKKLDKINRPRLPKTEVRVVRSRRLWFEHRRNSKEKQKTSIPKHYPPIDEWVGAFRMRAKRSVNEARKLKIKPINHDKYDLLSEKTETPFGKIARILLRDVRKLKNKKDSDFKHWKHVIAEIKKEGKRINIKRKDQKKVNNRLSVFRDILRKQRLGKDSIKKANVFGDDDDDDDEMLSNLMIKAGKEKVKPTDDELLMRAPVDIIRSAVKMGMTLAGQNTSDFDKKNVKMISPRLFSLLPDESDNKTVKLISPSLFALHDEDQGIEKETSLVRAMSVFSKNDHDAWLDLIIEAGGVSDALDSMKKDLFTMDETRRKDDPFHSPEGQPLWFSKENVTEMFGEQERVKVEIFEKLQNSFTKEQLSKINTTGYIVMNEKQLDMVYGPKSPYHDTETRKRLSNVSAAEVPTIINRMVHGLAAETLQFQAQRRNAIVLSPLVLSAIIAEPAVASQPVILSPVLLTPLILSPAIFGAVILSPWVFVPVIVSPRLLSPVVLSPVMFSPVVLSPLALAPLILSPGVGAPFILSPLVLSPFILSPVAISPLILAPFALTPFIGIPHTLSPLILSPFVLSPVIYSPPFISAFVLSPHALSPIIHSDGKYFTSILSPSWLS